MQQDWWGFGVGDKTMNTVLVDIPVVVQQDLQINLKKNQQEPNKKCTFSAFIPWFWFTVLSATQNKHFYSNSGASDAGGAWTTVWETLF